MAKKKKDKKKKKKKIKTFQAEKPVKPSFVAVDNSKIRKKKKKEKRKFKTTAKAVENKDGKLMKTKRKDFEESSCSKAKKRKINLECDERKEHCQELNQINQNKKIIPKSEQITQHTGRKVTSTKDNDQVTMKIFPEYENQIERSTDIGSSQKRKQRRGKDRKKQANQEYFGEFDFKHLLFYPRKEMSQKLGLKKGTWSKKEERILKENMDRYLKHYNIDDFKKIIFAYRIRDTEEGKKWIAFAKSTEFYRKLSNGINRSCFAVYTKVFRMFDERNHHGKFSKSEEKELLRLVEVHGKDWAKIGQIMEVSRLAALSSYSRITETSRSCSGPWQEAEVKSLKEAVRKVTNTKDGEEVYSGIYWKAVASLVKTRNVFQCRDKWLSYVCWKDCQLNTDVETWGPVNDVELIDKIYKSQVAEECDIDWLSLSSHFEKARSPEWVRKKFSILKRKYCKSIDFEVTDFEDVIDYLYNDIAIDLQNQLFQQQQQSSSILDS